MNEIYFSITFANNIYIYQFLYIDQIPSNFTKFSD